MIFKDSLKLWCLWYQKILAQIPSTNPSSWNYLSHLMLLRWWLALLAWGGLTPGKYAVVRAGGGNRWHWHCDCRCLRGSTQGSPSLITRGQRPAHSCFSARVTASLHVAPLTVMPLISCLQVVQTVTETVQRALRTLKRHSSTRRDIMSSQDEITCFLWVLSLCSRTEWYHPSRNPLGLTANKGGNPQLEHVQSWAKAMESEPNKRVASSELGFRMVYPVLGVSRAGEGEK